jgi:Mg-chelatase subunit ChlD
MKYIAPEEIQDIQLKGTDGKTYQAQYDGVKLSIVEQEEEQEEMMSKLFKQAGNGVGKSEKSESKKAELPKINDSVFRQRLASIMLDNKYDRKLRGRTRGRLDTTNLHKVGVDSPSIFSQKASRKNKEYNVVLLVDCSGSMQHHNRYIKAGEVASFLSSNFSGLNINLAVVSFNHFVSVVKGFDEVVDPQKIAQHISDATNGNGNGCNHDLPAMQFAYDLFKGRKGQNLMLMMSDGEPATCGYQREVDNDPKEYKKQLKEFRKDKVTRVFRSGGYEEEESHYNDEDRCIFYHEDGDYMVPLSEVSGHYDDRKAFEHLVKSQRNVESVGIGIEVESWQVPDNIVVNNLEELKPQILKIISKKIRRA